MRMSAKGTKYIATGMAKYGGPLLIIAATVWLIVRAGGGAPGMRAVALAIFNAPILAILACLPFIASLRQALMEKGPQGPIESTSYSRITGLFGAVIVTSFFWAMGNVVLWQIFEQPEKVESMIDGVWKFFVLGAALFLPYAFNQLRAIMTDRQRDLATHRPTLAPAVAVPGTSGTTVLANKA